MDLSKIILNLANEEFILNTSKELNVSLWRTNFEKIPVKIEIPLIYENHKELLYSFKRNPYADRITVIKEKDENGCVNRGKYYVRRTNYDIFKKIEKYAQNDKIKGYIELGFKFNSHALNSTIIKFKQFEDVLISYEIIFPRVHSQFFTWKEETKVNDYCFALWYPQNIETFLNINK